MDCKALILICFSAAALAGPSEPLRQTGWAYERGLGVARDYHQAFNLYCRAAQLGDAVAAYDLGFMYFNGRGLKTDLSLAMYWMRIAAKGGDGLAKRMALHYRDVTVKDDLNCRLEAPSKPSSIASLVKQISAPYGIDPRWVMAVIQVESGFDSNAISNKNAQGLMQLTLETAERFGVKDVLNPQQNIQGGVAYLHWLMQRFSNKIEWVTAAYNAGEASVERYQGIPPYQETQRYVRQVLAHYQKLEKTSFP